MHYVFSLFWTSTTVGLFTFRERSERKIFLVQSGCVCVCVSGGWWWCVWWWWYFSKKSWKSGGRGVCVIWNCFRTLDWFLLILFYETQDEQKTVTHPVLVVFFINRISKKQSQILFFKKKILSAFWGGWISEFFLKIWCVCVFFFELLRTLPSILPKANFWRRNHMKWLIPLCLTRPTLKRFSLATQKKKFPWIWTHTPSTHTPTSHTQRKTSTLPKALDRLKTG